MTKEELASHLDGIEYPQNEPKELWEQARESGLVVVFGGCDDLMEFRGAIHDEIGCYDGGTAHLDDAGELMTQKCDNDDCPHEIARYAAPHLTIDARWCKAKQPNGEGYIPWTYKTAIPHAAFKMMEDGEIYCIGIVFSQVDVAAAIAPDSAP